MKKLLIIFLILIMITTYAYADNGNNPAPDWTISVADFTKQLISSMGYSDIDETSDNLYYINKAKDLDIIKDNEIKDYNKCITRGQIARMIVRSINEKYPKNIHLYINQIRDYSYTKLEFQEYILKAYVKGIITGYDSKVIKANHNATISESSIIIERMLDKTKRVPPPELEENTQKILYKNEVPSILLPVESVPSTARTNEVFTVSAEQSAPEEKIKEYRHQMSIGNMNSWVEVSTNQTFTQKIENEGLVYYRVIVKDNEGNWSKDWSIPVAIRITNSNTKYLTANINIPEVVYEGVPFKIDTKGSNVKHTNETLTLIHAVSKGIADYSFDFSIPYKGELTPIGGNIYFEEPGYQTVDFKIKTDNKIAHDQKVFNILSTPHINTVLEGETKENRLLTFDFNNDIFHKDYPIDLNQSYVKVIDLITGEEATFNKNIINTDIIKGKSFIDNKIEFIIKKSGIYKVVKYIEDTRGKGCLKESIIEINEDKPPVAMINLLDEYFRDSVGNISFEIKKEGSSPDKDRLQSNFIYYKIDSDNDGLFTDEVNRSISYELNEHSKIFNYNKIGKIQFTYIVRENYETLLDYVSVDDFLSDTFVKVVDIQNHPPHTILEFMNNYDIDIKVFSNMTNEANTNISKLINILNAEKNINANISLKEFSDISSVSDNTNYIIVIGNDKNNNYSKFKDYVNVLKKQKIKVIWIGDFSNINIGQEIIKSTGGLYINYSNIESAFNNVKNYLTHELPNLFSSPFMYLTKGEPIKYVTHYSDPENDPMKIINGQQWRYTLDISKPYKDGIPPWNNIWLDSKLDSINYSGEYHVEYRARDNTTKDQNFDSYNKWSTVDSAKLLIKDDSLLTIDLNINPEYPTPVSPGENLTISAMTFSTSVPEKVEAWIDENKKISLKKTKIQGNKTFWSGNITLSNSYKGDYIIYTKAYMGNKIAKDQDLVKVFVNRTPSVSIKKLIPSYIYEGDDVDINIEYNDKDLEILNLDLKVYLNGILIIDHNKSLKPPYKLLDSELLKNALPGNYTVEASLSDQNGKKDYDKMSFKVNELGIYGSIKHTQQWDKNRINYNKQRTNTANNPRTYDIFWSGEKFLLYGLTTNIIGNNDLKAEKVTVKILNEKYSTNMYPSNSTNWYGSLFDENMINRWGVKSPEKLIFRFTAYYSNNIVKYRDVEITIDNTEKQWKVKKIN